MNSISIKSLFIHIVSLGNSLSVLTIPILTDPVFFFILFYVSSFEFSSSFCVNSPVFLCVRLHLSFFSSSYFCCLSTLFSFSFSFCGSPSTQWDLKDLVLIYLQIFRFLSMWKISFCILIIIFLFFRLFHSYSSEYWFLCSLILLFDYSESVILFCIQWFFFTLFY